ncbi:type VI secretion system membrane subunit TssM [Paracoccus siganidrum]|uniref:Type VI secretion system membrane subunit TssM n=1 Tax=Paracoccus siganidrum TaxID=1276757 RepID=A0A419AC87_9RHOB|nr:type VI secretion system membrane subunit TssM [Paracoccus siganidrum]RJL21835.1 type VI secretion system membrane subunit TssM [Paracoccus siganidrum]RMC28833.1 type VI secretion system membrane subunit TssM [Paracoccus siganidrum]
MRLLGIYVPTPRWRRHAWWRWTVTVVGLAALCLAVWFGGPMTGWAPLAGLWLRLAIIGAILAVFLTVILVRWRRRVRAARQIEDALIPPEPEGDGKILAEKMTEALAVLKKSGGASSLYDLPWYVIIGPPGAGKTTALANSGLDFPLAQSNAVSGFGGTRNMDFWFAEDAVLIDTAGRYTTQDSDAVADKASWDAFLGLLKRTRPNRPINGVILSFSAEDMMKDDPATLAAHAETVRARLAELHEQLKIDFPVYVMFTKADLIAGFREYFASFSLNRRKLVWGATFQTKDRKAITHEAVPQEFDRLVARLSDEIIDRLSEEPDGVARIAIFGLPGQMALLRDNVAGFLRRVFEPTRYKTNAILRGFYFTSGTQEGTPVDQVLGAIQQPGAGASLGPGFQAAFMSGRGKSFFIHDLLRRVIFPEQGWVSHDQKAVRRAALIRTTALAAIILATVGGAAALGYSYWKNLQLVRTAEAQTAAYMRAAAEELQREVIDDTDLRPVVPLLNAIATMPAGYGDSERPGLWEGLGLGQRERLNRVATDSYAEALERMLRPRLVLDLERRIPQTIAAGETTEIYRALKVYLLLGKQGETTDDDAILAWFDQSWRQEYPGRTGLDLIDQLKAHLTAMLRLDDSRKLLVDLDQATVERARAAIAQLPLDEQAYAIIKDGAIARGLEDWQLESAVGGGVATQVFAARDGADLASLTVPGLYTYEGFWSYFYDQLAVVGEELRRDQWVLGDLANTTEIEGRLARLDRDLMERYRGDFIAAWNGVLDNLTLNSMVADKPQYAALGNAASASASPILALVREVSAQTRLSREYEQLEGIDPEAPQQDAGETAGGVASAIGDQLTSRIQSRSSGVQRILLDAATQQGAKGQLRAGGASEQTNSVTAPIDAISKAFENWHLLAEGEPGQRPVDTLLGNLGAIWENLRLAEHNPDQSAAALPTLLNTLTQYNSQLPDPLARMVTRAESDFRSGASDASIEVMNRALTDRITFFCRDTITSAYPFASSSRSLSIDNFSRFFGPGGEMDRYFTEYLEPYVERSTDGLTWRDDKEISGRLSPTTLKQFERAERIRRAFFAGGGTSPSVEITVAQVDAHPSVESAVLAINDTVVQTATGSLSRTVVWPGAGRSTILQLSPPLQRESVMRFEGSSWTFMQFLNAATYREQRGDVLRATFVLGGRNITYDFTVNAIANPFTMPEIREFECPQSID